MKWRHRIGAAIMIAGTLATVAAIAWTALVIAMEMHAKTGLFDLVLITASLGGWPLGTGIATMVGGRAVYGHWRTAAPVVNFTGEITRTVGLVSAVLLGGMLVFLLATGFKYEDTPAAAALAIGAVFGIWVAQFGGTLRGRGYQD